MHSNMQYYDNDIAYFHVENSTLVSIDERNPHQDPPAIRNVNKSSIKNEVLNNDFFMLSNEDMDTFGNGQNNFHILQDGNHQDAAIRNANTFDNQTGTLYADDNYSVNIEEFGTFDSTKTENGSYTYKMRDGKQIKVWECAVCSKEFGHQYTLMRHIPTHTDERKFQCNTCGKAFRQMSTLSQHRAIHSADRPYICEVCQKTFNRVSTLISHRKTHTGLKPHRCHLCNKAFHQKGNLRNHVFTHTNERPYKCDVCAKGFNQMSNLMCHKVKAHQRADKPRYICQICDEEFPKRVGLRNHEQYQHGATSIVSSSGPVIPPSTKYTNGVLVDPINTAAMQHAIATNQTPFALLRPLYGIPVLVRVLPAGDKQMLVPATAEDLKKHGKITIHPQVSDEIKKECPIDDPLSEHTIDTENQEVSIVGTTVQIKIPIVATVVQKCGLDGSVCMSVESPGPNSSDGSTDNFYVTSTTNDSNNLLSTTYSSLTPAVLDTEFENTNTNLDNSNRKINPHHMIDDSEDAKLLNAEDSKNTCNNLSHTSLHSTLYEFLVFGNDFSSAHNEIYATTDEDNIEPSDQEILEQIDKENVLNISFIESNEEPIFDVIDPRLVYA